MPPHLLAARLPLSVPSPLSPPDHNTAANWCPGPTVAQWIIDQGVRQYKYLFGSSYGGYWYWDDANGWYGGPWYEGRYSRKGDLVALDGVMAPTSSNSIDHSETNTQVSGVDEADLYEWGGQGKKGEGTFKEKRPG